MKGYILQKVPMSDGIQLATDIWLPEGPGPFPVLISRVPYHRVKLLGDDTELWVDNFPEIYTRWGYVYVVQDTRGKFDSDGEFYPLRYEANDGKDTLNWVAEQKWCNGNIGMVGKSYLGMVQIPAAISGHEALKCIVPRAAANNLFRDWIRYDGCFALANALEWSLLHATCRTQAPVKHFSMEELYGKVSLEDVFDRVGYYSQFLQDCVDHDTYDDYWASFDQTKMYELIKIPALHVGGWYDHLSRGQFESYKGIRNKGATELARRNQHLLVTPGDHITVDASDGVYRRHGDWDFGPATNFSVLKYERRFLDFWLKGEDKGFSKESPVKIFLMGENRWMNLSNWPPPEGKVQNWFLRSDGNANGITGNGLLSLERPQIEQPDKYCFDPKNPVPTLGGPIYWNLPFGGPVDQRMILDRKDVLFYCSEELDKKLAIVGEVTLDLWFTCDSFDTDFVAKFCVIKPNGSIMPLTLGSIRCRFRESYSNPKPLEKGVPTQVQLQMGNTAYVFPKRSKIALIVTSSSFPRILPNPNTMAPTWKERSPKVAKIEILHSENYLSCLNLPVFEM